MRRCPSAMLLKLQSDVDNIIQWQPCYDLRARTLHRFAGVPVFFHDLMLPLSKLI
jgi:hypothetical protein